MATSSCLRSLGRTGVLDRAESWLERRLVPKLLDPNAVSDSPALIRLRSSSTRVLCSPFVHTHWAPYWFGHLYEWELQIFLERTLRAGDTYIDIGTNFGHFAFLAGGLVGPGGTVQAFEPNPRLAQLVRTCAERVVPAKLSLQEVALGDVESRSELRIPYGHSGGASLRDGNNEAVESATVCVPVLRGDTVLVVPRHGSRVIAKVDVEGFEPNVVAGMQGFIRDYVDAIVLEVTPSWIGGPPGVGQLFQVMEDLGCRAWRVKARRGRHLLACRCRPQEITQQENIYFVKTGFERSCGWETLTTL